MKLCAICDVSARDLRRKGETLVECSACGETVCTAACAEESENEQGVTVYTCVECSRRASRQASFASRY